jgi:uracil-DNA glycosylase family 4
MLEMLENSLPDGLAVLEKDISECRRCPRLVKWRESVAIEKRASYSDEEYWGRGVPGFGDPNGKLFVLGLAPAAHGGNRTGRVFTGDRSGDWLYGALHRAQFANQSFSHSRDDGLSLYDVWVSAAVRCAPPDNKPTVNERDRCLPYLRREIAALKNLRVVVALGSYAHDVICREFTTRPKPRFGHAAEAMLPGGLLLIDSYHPSQRNTFTGRLTEEAFDQVFLRAREALKE